MLLLQGGVCPPQRQEAIHLLHFPNHIGYVSVKALGNTGSDVVKVDRRPYSKLRRFVPILWRRTAMPKQWPDNVYNYDLNAM